MQWRTWAGRAAMVGLAASTLYFWQNDRHLRHRVHELEHQLESKPAPVAKPARHAEPLPTELSDLFRSIQLPAEHAAPSDKAAPATRIQADPRARAEPIDPATEFREVFYGAIDAVSETHNWDQSTYDRVTGVFERVTRRMANVIGRVKNGELHRKEAMQQLLTTHERALTDLKDTLDQDSLVALRDEMVRATQQRMQTLRQERRSNR